MNLTPVAKSNDIFLENCQTIKKTIGSQFSYK